VPFAFVVAWSVFGLFTFLAVGGTAQFMQLAWGMWFSELVVFGGLTVLGWQALRLRPLRAMGLDRFELQSFGLGVAFGVVNYLAWAVPLMALAQSVFPKSMVEQFDSSQIFERQSAAELVFILLGVSIAAPLGEELFFRGFIQRGIAEHREPARAIVVTAFIFSAFHLDPVGLTARFELGVLFGLLAWRSGSIWPAIGAHAANNAVSALLFLAAGDAHKEDELVWWAPMLLCVIGNLGLFALVRVARDRLSVRRPMTFEGAEQRPLLQLLAPWLISGTVAVAGMLALDHRGVRLNLIEAQLHPSKELRKRADVKAMRAKVRAGDAPFEDYEALLK
jgi:membrane protease YdiL (CAAX protease family)